MFINCTSILYRH